MLTLHRCRSSIRLTQYRLRETLAAFSRPLFPTHWRTFCLLSGALVSELPAPGPDVRPALLGADFHLLIR